jgi:hypothetical protein
MKNDELEIAPRGKGFVLRRGSSRGGVVHEIELTDDNILTLSQSAEQLAQLVLSKHSEQANPAAVFPADQIGLNCDQHRDELHLELVSPGGSRKIVAIPLQKALALAEALPSYLDGMKRYKASQQQH